MFLVVGLGNPGPQYRSHRHNVGFMVLERLQHRVGASEFRDKFHGVCGRGVIAGQVATLLKPTTFMNASGRAVQAAMTSLGCKLTDVIVVHDDLDLPVFDLRIKVGGGHGGHNGLRDIIQCVGGDFIRVRIGIGRPTVGEVIPFVLSNFTKDEQPALSDTIDRATDAVEHVISHGVEPAMNKLNTRPKPARSTPAKA